MFDQAAIERFWSKVDVRSETECWEWVGTKTRSGYGQISIDYVNWRASRVSVIISGREIPTGLIVMHSCDNPPCVNPDHLFIGTTSDNQRDSVRKGRFRWSPGRSRLTPDQVREIRLRVASGERQTRVAAHYRVTQSLVSGIVSRRYWPSIK